MSNGAITTLIKQTLWDWACAHNRTKDVIFLEQAHDDMSYPLRVLLAAFGLFPDAAPVRAALQTLERGYYPYNTGFSAFLAMIKLQYLHKCLIFLHLLASH